MRGLPGQDTDPWKAPLPEHAGLLKTEEMFLDLFKFLCVYSKPKDKGYKRALKRIVNGRLKTQDLDKIFFENGTAISERKGNHTAGQFSAALVATGLVWGLSHKTIQKKLKTVGYPTNLKEIERMLDLSRSLK